MHLIEVLVAGSVFVIASGSSVQHWSATAVRTHQLATREQLEQRIEQDRVQLMALWRNSPPTQAPNQSSTALGVQDTAASTEGLQGPAPTIDPTPPSGCAATSAQLLALASNRAAPPNVHREIQLSPDGRALQIRWQANGDAVVRRHRLVTPAGLGLCKPLATNADQAEPLQPAAQDQILSELQSQPSDATPLTDSQVEGVAE